MPHHPRAIARRTIEPARRLRRDAVDIFDLADRLQRIAIGAVVEGAAFHEDGADDVVAAACDVRVKLVEPGYAPTTRFAANGEERMRGLVPEAYARYAQDVFAGFADASAFTVETDVAQAVWEAVQEAGGQLLLSQQQQALQIDVTLPEAKI